MPDNTRLKNDDLTQDVKNNSGRRAPIKEMTENAGIISLLVHVYHPQVKILLI